MENADNELNFLQTLDEIKNDAYKYERFVKYIREFHEEWEELDSKEEFYDRKKRLWGTEVKVNSKEKIDEIFVDLLYTNVIEFFDERNIMTIDDIHENHLLDLLYHEYIGAKKYLGFLEILFIKGSNDEFHINETEELEKQDKAIDIIPEIENKTSELRNVINKISNKKLSDNFNYADNMVYKIGEPTNIMDDIMPTNEIVSILDNSVDIIIENYRAINEVVTKIRDENIKLINTIKDKDKIIKDNLEIFNENTNEYESDINELKEVALSEIEKCELEINNLKLDFSKIKDEKFLLEDQLDNFKEEKSQLQGELNRANQLNDEKDRIIELINRELENVESIRNLEVQEYKSEVKSLKMDIEKYKSEINEFYSLKGLIDNILKKFKA